MLRRGKLLLLALLLAATSIVGAAATPEAATDDARLNAFLDRAYDARMALFPEELHRPGTQDRYDRLETTTHRPAGLESSPS